MSKPIQRTIHLAAYIFALAVSAVGSRLALADVINVPAEYATIQEAIDAAAPSGDEIIVAPGTYNEAIDLLGKEVYLHSSDGRDVTTIDGAGLDTSVVTCISGETADTILEGFTITGGIGTLIGSRTYGGGMFISNESGVTVVACRFVDNSATRGGGGIYLDESCELLATDCSFVRNSAESGGGMQVCSGGAVHLTSCRFEENSADSNGGGIENSGGIDLEHCEFIRNHAEAYGGGVANSFSHSLSFDGCIFIENTANRGGGMANRFESDPRITECRFERNHALTKGGGIEADFYWGIALEDTVVCDNTPDQIVGEWVDRGGSCVEANCGTCPAALLFVSPYPLVPGEAVIVELSGGTPNALAYLAYSLAGRGESVIPKLNIRLDLAQPIRVAGRMRLNADGEATHELRIPKTSEDVRIWFQAAQRDVKSNVVSTLIKT